MGAGKGGDGGGVDAAAAPEAAQPVVLKMDLHCAGCAHKVKKAIKRLPGVESIVADVAAKRVVVAGTADAAALKARIEAKTSKAVEVVSAGSGPKKALESKDSGAGEEKVDKDSGAGEKKGDKDASPKEEKQPPEETKPNEVGTQEAMLPTQSAPAPNDSSDPQLKFASDLGFRQETVLLKIRLHCDGCADRIRRRIYKFKGVKDVALEGNAKDEVKVTGTMDVLALLAYLREKLNRPVDAVAAGKKDGGSGEGKDNKKDKGGDSDKNKDAAAAAGGDDKKGKAKGIDAAGPSTAAAAAALVAPPAEASTYHVPPPYGHVAYPQGPAASSYYPYYGMGSSDSSAATYYYYQQQQQQQQHPHPEAGQHQAYAPYPYHMAPPPQLFSDENPNACSVM